MQFVDDLQQQLSLIGLCPKPASDSCATKITFTRISPLKNSPGYVIRATLSHMGELKLATWKRVVVEDASEFAWQVASCIMQHQNQQGIADKDDTTDLGEGGMLEQGSLGFLTPSSLHDSRQHWQ
jgi:hypothetical protein